jgi:RNA polymerase sigma-70 factor, ECF subfamily
MPVQTPAASESSHDRSDADLVEVELDRAVESALREHGGEIFGWLLATLSSEADATDAFSLFSEELWRSLARHEGRCSIRTWCFMLARHCVARVLEARRTSRAVPLSEAPIARLAAQVRDATLSYLRTDVKQRVRSLREQLDPDDQALLVLRVDKDLGWRDIAIVMCGDCDDDELARHAARLRKRFERVKAQLRELAVARPRRYAGAGAAR